MNNTHDNDNIHDAEIIVRVHPARQVAANPHNKPSDLGCESACKLLSSTLKTKKQIKVPQTVRLRSVNKTK